MWLHRLIAKRSAALWAHLASRARREALRTGWLAACTQSSVDVWHSAFGIRVVSFFFELAIIVVAIVGTHITTTDFLRYRTSIALSCLRDVCRGLPFVHYASEPRHDFSCKIFMGVGCRHMACGIGNHQTEINLHVANFTRDYYCIASSNFRVCQPPFRVAPSVTAARTTFFSYGRSILFGTYLVTSKCLCFCAIGGAGCLCFGARLVRVCPRTLAFGSMFLLVGCLSIGSSVS